MRRKRVTLTPDHDSTVVMDDDAFGEQGGAPDAPIDASGDRTHEEGEDLDRFDDGDERFDLEAEWSLLAKLDIDLDDDDGVVRSLDEILDVDEDDDSADDEVAA